jgi:sugar lactone lactonase YvrE
MAGVALSSPVPVLSLGAPLLEGPVWLPEDAALWFVCIKTKRISRFDPKAGTVRHWSAPAQVGFLAPLEGSTRFIAGLQTGLALFDPTDGSFTPLVDPEPDLPTNRLNDATVDPEGRLWFGTMDDGEAAATGRFYRHDADGTVAVKGPIAITNGPAVCPAGRTLYHVDTLGGEIHACEIAADGSLGPSRLFAKIDPADGYPDGPVVDSEGALWIGLYNGGAARRYAPDGTLLETVRFPVSAITKLAFGGPELKTVYATTAAKHLDDAGRRAEPHAGDLFAFEVDVPGLPARRVKLPG